MQRQPPRDRSLGSISWPEESRWFHRGQAPKPPVRVCESRPPPARSPRVQRQIMKTRLIAVLASALAFLAGCSESATEKAKAEILAADKAFAAQSGKVGVKAAFQGRCRRGHQASERHGARARCRQERLRRPARDGDAHLGALLRRGRLLVRFRLHVGAIHAHRPSAEVRAEALYQAGNVRHHLEARCLGKVEGGTGRGNAGRTKVTAPIRAKERGWPLVALRAP